MSERRRGAVVVLGALVLGMVGLAATSRPGPVARADEAPTDAALERTRAQVQMLDTLYKTTVVAITDTYKTGAPAIHVGQRVFREMKQAGYHDVKLVDATGAPMNEANLPQTDFERRAAEQIKAGKPYYDEVVADGSARRLLAATVVPAVHERCAACHGLEKDDLIGFIRYDLEIK